MRPSFRLLADGRDITANVQDRLLSLTYRDEAETKSDRLTVKLDDRPDRESGRHVALPRIGTVLELSLGYAETGLTPMGKWTVDEIQYDGPPATLTVGAKAAEMATPFRSATCKSWDDTTLGAIAREIAAEHGYEARLDGTLAAVAIPHEDQVNESPMAFLNRLAARHDGVAKPVNGFLVLAPKGTAKSVTGQTLPDATLVPGRLTKWTYKHSARSEAGQARKSPAGGSGGAGSGGGIRSVYWDKDEARLKEATEGNPPYQNTRYACAGPGEAGATAAATKNTKDRGKDSFSCSCPGDPAFMAEQKLILSGFRPGIPTDWRVKSVEHKLDNSGYSCSIEAELFSAGQADVAARANSGST